MFTSVLPIGRAYVILRNVSDQGHHVGNDIGYKRLSENKRFPNHRWYSDAIWGENGWMFSIIKYMLQIFFAIAEPFSRYLAQNCERRTIEQNFGRRYQ